MLGSIRRPEEEEVFGVQDWAEVHRLNHQLELPDEHRI